MIQWRWSCDQEDILFGCTDEAACNYDSSPTLNEDNSTCTYLDGICETCVEGEIVDNDSDEDGLWIKKIFYLVVQGAACNYDSSPTLNEDNSTCTYLDGICETCVEGEIVDNDSDEDGLCDQEDILFGCTDEAALIMIHPQHLMKIILLVHI